MSRRRAIYVGLLIGGALVACGGVRAQQTQPDPTRTNNAAGEEPLRRLDPSTLAGGDYGGTEPAPLAGGDYGLTSPTENPYGSSVYGSRYQGQRGPTASRSWQGFHRTEV